jgi:hypothetical protein
MKYKKVLFAISIALLSIGAYTLSNKQDELKTVVSVNRLPASVKPIKKIEPTSKKIFKTIIDKLDEPVYLLTKKELSKSFSESDNIIEIKPVGEKIYSKLSRKVKFKHTKIKIRKKNSHMLSSFDALIDPNTGKIVRTWNKTQVEHPKKITFKAEGNEYRP